MGLFPGQPTGSRIRGLSMPPSEASPGAVNGVPSPDVLIPGPEALAFREDFFLGWYAVPHAISYNLQIDDNAEFESPERSRLHCRKHLYEPEETPGEGIYYWRLQAVDETGKAGAFTEALQITIVDIAPPDISEQASTLYESNALVSADISWSNLSANTLISVSDNVTSLARDVKSAMETLLHNNVHFKRAMGAK